MPILYTKIIISLFFMAAGATALLTMLYLMGRPEKKLSPAAVRKTHRVAGIIFTILLAVLAYIGGKFVGAMGDGMSLRAVLHGVFALGLIGVFIIKILIIRHYRELMRFVPTLGLIVFVLAFVVFFTSAGFYFVVGRGPEPAARAAKTGHGEQAGTNPESETGSAIFARNCAGCHHADSEKAMFGPGLKGLMQREALRSSGRPPTEATVRDQILSPVGTMPAFTSFSDHEMARLLAYLGSL